MTRGTLIRALWGDQPAPTAVNILQTRVKPGAGVRHLPRGAGVLSDFRLSVKLVDHRGADQGGVRRFTPWAVDEAARALGVRLQRS